MINDDNARRTISTSTLESQAGFLVNILDLGASIHSIQVPTADGLIDVTLSYSCLQDYCSDAFYLGATLGRYANRIGAARFSLGGTTYQLDANESGAGHCLHGGNQGFHRQLWSLVKSGAGDSIECRHTSAAGAQGFPGELKSSVTYKMVGDFALEIGVAVSSNAETVVNIANHAYFNLNIGDDTIDNHVLQINADSYTPVTDTLIPTGDIESVNGTMFDFRDAVCLRDAVSGAGRVIDNNFVLSGMAGHLRQAASLFSPESGIRLLVHTTQPGMQVYTGEHLRTPFTPRQGICLEAQNFPDAPNNPAFPSARLMPGQIYQQRTIYEFVPGTRDTKSTGT